jgi:hypothetical protein
VGRPRYQELKFHHAPTIKPLRKIVVRTNKGRVSPPSGKRGGEYGLDFLDYPTSTITSSMMPPTFTASGTRLE